MNEQGKIIKKIADCLAIILIVMIIGSILGATGILGSIISSDSQTPSDELMTFSSQDINELDIEVACADIAFVSSDSLGIEADNACFRIKSKGGKITVEEKGNLLKFNNSRKLTVFVPGDFAFEKVSLELGASALEAESLKTKLLDLDTGAGYTLFKELSVTEKADIDCGAGEIVIEKSSIEKLDFSLGVGSADITSEIGRNADIESGVGELALTLEGSKEKYCFDIETGLGSIMFDGASVRNDTLLGNGDTKIQLEGGVGSIDVSFPS